MGVVDRHEHKGMGLGLRAAQLERGSSLGVRAPERRRGAPEGIQSGHREREGPKTRGWPAAGRRTVSAPPGTWWGWFSGSVSLIPEKCYISCKNILKSWNKKSISF